MPTESANTLWCFSCPTRLWHTLRDFIRPDFKALQGIRAKCSGDGDIGCIAAARDQHSSNPGHIVPWIERMPGAAEIDFNPGGKIHQPVRRRGPHVAKVSGA